MRVALDLKKTLAELLTGRPQPLSGLELALWDAFYVELDRVRSAGMDAPPVVRWPGATGELVTDDPDRVFGPLPAP